MISWIIFTLIMIGMGYTVGRTFDDDHVWFAAWLVILAYLVGVTRGVTL